MDRLQEFYSKRGDVFTEHVYITTDSMHNTPLDATLHLKVSGLRAYFKADWQENYYCLIDAQGSYFYVDCFYIDVKPQEGIEYQEIMHRDLRTLDRSSRPTVDDIVDYVTKHQGNGDD